MIENKLLIIGPLPENHGIGGVTIHVQRLLDYLDKNGVSCSFCDYGKVSCIGLLKRMSRTSTIHIHISNPVFLFLITLCCRLMCKKVIVTLHGNYGRFSSFKNFLVRRTISMSTIPVLVNEKSYIICRKFNKRAVLIPAFIPPQKEEKLNSEILSLLERLHKEGKKIVSTNAYNVSFDKYGNDTYGIDFLVQYFKKSADYAMLVSDPSGNYAKRYEGREMEVDGNVFFIDYPHSFFELLKHVDYFVRNTSTDGDALSVKEALYLGVPTLCTDVVDRPESVRLFKYCDRISFEKALMVPAMGNRKIENGAEKIVTVYKELLKC